MLELLSLDTVGRIVRAVASRLRGAQKIEAKSIGVGQYQHDNPATGVPRSTARSSRANVNTASRGSYVSGIGPGCGSFSSTATRRALSRQAPPSRPEPGLRAERFLRVRGIEPLDNSAVHPESYHVVEKMARASAGRLR